MNVKEVFNHISRNQLLKCIIDLDIDGNLVAWIKSFLTNRKIQLVIDEHKNKKRKIEIRIPQGSFIV